MGWLRCHWLLRSGLQVLAGLAWMPFLLASSCYWFLESLLFGVGGGIRHCLGFGLLCGIQGWSKLWGQPGRSMVYSHPGGDRI